jgi:hypothetical protein
MPTATITDLKHKIAEVFGIGAALQDIFVEGESDAPLNNSISVSEAGFVEDSTAFVVASAYSVDHFEFADDVSSSLTDLYLKNEKKTVGGSGTWNWVRAPQFPSSGQYQYSVRVNQLRSSCDVYIGVGSLSLMELNGTGNPDAKGGWIWKGFISTDRSELYSDGLEHKSCGFQCKQGDTIIVAVDMDAHTVTFTCGGWKGTLSTLTKDGVAPTDLCPVMSLFYKHTQVSLLEE